VVNRPLVPYTLTKRPPTATKTTRGGAPTADPGASKNSDDDDDEEENSDEEVSSTVGVPLGDQDAPLSFSSAMQTRSWMTAPLTAPMMPEMYGHSNYWQQQQHYAQDDSADMQQVRCSTSYTNSTR
jgi:hypothetical protein